VVIDAFTRYTFCPTTTSKETCEQLQLIFNLFGIPREIVSDRGTAFTSNEFAQFVNSQKIKHRKVAVAAPWANGLTERANKFLKSSLVKLSDKPQDWKANVHIVQYVVNNTVNSSINIVTVL